MKHLITNMLRLFLPLSFLSLISTRTLAQRSAPEPYASSARVNYVRSWDMVKPETNPDNINTGNSLQQSRMTTQYLDGLGRPVQTVVKQGSMITGNDPADLVRPVVYDEFGREQFKYLPFAANGTDGNTHINDGLFKLNPFQQQSEFCKAQYTGENWYYSQTIFEESPLNRILQNFAPGNNWVGTVANDESNSHSVKIKFWVNTDADAVRIWDVTDAVDAFASYTTPAAYPAGVLYKNVTVDENGSRTEDRQGRAASRECRRAAALAR